ncbi:hypothetical protein [Rhizorhabdus wittichii]|nr:hypothetical protein [Rhizorhabdus wittichii]
MTNAAPYRILCLDGGRMHGLFTTAYLNVLADHMPIILGPDELET